MRFVVTCFLEKRQSLSFIVYGSSLYHATTAFERMLREAKPLHDTIKLSDGQDIPIRLILAYHIEEARQPF